MLFRSAAAKRATELVKANSPHEEISKNETDKSLDRFDRLRNGNGSNKTSELRLSMQKTMQSKCARSEEHTSELQSRTNLVCRLLLEKKKPLNRIDLFFLLLY